ncbi:MAG: HAMP domain-containing histidine kinase [Bacteroidales bacterium]|jgi:signal transduction histidine kinase|nr:HAMP domain-containing histidine kinase [Bacteroidales bacterium]
MPRTGVIFFLLIYLFNNGIVAQSTTKIDSLLNCLSLSRKDHPAKVDLLNNIAYEYYLHNEFEKTKTYAQKAINMAKEKDYEPGLARGFNILGIGYMYTEDYYQSFVMYKKAESLYTRLKDTLRLCYVYGNIALVSATIKDFENSNLYGHKLLDLAMESKNIKEISRALNYIFMQLEVTMDEKLLDAIEMVLSDTSCYGIYKGSVIVHHSVYLAHRDKDQESIKRIHEAMPLLKDVTNPNGLDFLYKSLAIAHAYLGNEDSALFYVEKYKYLSTDDIQARYMTTVIHEHLDSLRGDYYNAYKHHQERMALKDSIFLKSKTLETARMKTWDQFEKSEADFNTLHKEKQIQRKMIFLLTILLILIVILSVLLFRYYKRRVVDHRLLKKTNEELQKLHGVKDRLFSLVAHDLRSPIASLSILLKSASQSFIDADTQRDMLKELSHQVDDTLLLINNLLYWSKTQMKGIHAEPENFDLKERSLMVSNQLNGQASRKGIILQNNVASIKVYADTNMFDVVLRNLISNAIKFTHAKGTIKIESKLTGNQVTISVTDNGTGMPVEKQKKLFCMNENVICRGTANEKGSGLGLVLCKDFVEMNNGNIWFESLENEGSTFYFTVPVGK